MINNDKNKKAARTPEIIKDGNVYIKRELVRKIKTLLKINAVNIIIDRWKVPI